MNGHHMYDATEIFRTLPQHKKESFFKLGFYLIVSQRNIGKLYHHLNIFNSASFTFYTE